MAGLLKGTALALVGGWAANVAGVPLGWMLGAMAACAAGAMAGLSPRPVPFARELGQAIVGLSIGLKLTLPLLGVAFLQMPTILLSTLYIVGVTTMSAILLRRMTGVDPRTAFFATASAGVAEMALIARDRQADPAVVALVQALRVAVIVLLVPLIVQVGGPSRPGALPVQSSAHLADLLLLVIGAVLAAAALRRWTRMPNPWLFGPIAIGAVVAIALGTDPALPTPLLILAQLLLGMALGTRFERALLAAMPRIAMAGLVIAVLLTAAAALWAGILSHLTSTPFATVFLAVAPAGIAEMVLTAKLMGLDAATVTAFHLMRLLVVTAGVHATLGLYERLLRRASRHE